MNNLFPNINTTSHHHLPLHDEQDFIPLLILDFQATGKYHPNNSDLNYVSPYPIGFRGCYAYGQEDHNPTNNFPLNCSGQFNKHEFFVNVGHTSRNISAHL